MKRRRKQLKLLKTGSATRQRLWADSRTSPLARDRRLARLVQGNAVVRLCLGGDFVQGDAGREFDKRHASLSMLVERKHAKIGDDEVDDLRPGQGKGATMQELRPVLG